MWNFVGRQNDLEGNMENKLKETGFLVSLQLIINQWGNQSKMPAKYKNEYNGGLHALLGLILFQPNKDFGRFYAILSLFVLTSVGIIFYTGVKPFEPRERDYAMV